MKLCFNHHTNAILQQQQQQQRQPQQQQQQQQHQHYKDLMQTAMTVTKKTFCEHIF